MRVVVVLVSLVAVGCRPDWTPAEKLSDDCHVAARIGPPPVVIPDAAPEWDGGAPVARGIDIAGCSYAIASPLPPSTAWMDAQAATGQCGTPPRVAADVCREAGEMYATCDPEVLVPDLCGIEAGMQWCRATVWTVLCKQDADCPASFVCDPEFPGNWRTCERRCSVDADCGRCDLTCQQHLCAPRHVDLPVP